MSTIGEYIKQARLVRKKSIKDVADETKIKETFLKSIESERWKELPEYPVVLGFIKSISNALNLNKENLVAVFRRDYPPQKLEINPRPEPKKEFSWSPKLTFALGIGIILVVVLGYLGLQYASFLKPPILEVIKPEQGAVIFSKNIEVSGLTEVDATVFVNSQPAFVDDKGRFYTEIEAKPETVTLEIVAKSRSGKETRKTVNITIQIK